MAAAVARAVRAGKRRWRWRRERWRRRRGKDEDRIPQQEWKQTCGRMPDRCVADPQTILLLLLHPRRLLHRRLPHPRCRGGIHQGAIDTVWPRYAKTGKHIISWLLP